MVGVLVSVGICREINVGVEIELGGIDLLVASDDMIVALLQAEKKKMAMSR